MNKKSLTILILLTCWFTYSLEAQQSLLTPFRLSLPSGSLNIEYIDLDNDGDPDILQSTTSNNIPVQWIDDDDDMQEGDIEGDMDSDCLMLDRNMDGEYGSGHDLIIDWNDEEGDGKADMQVVADNSGLDDRGRFKAHYIWIIDSDNDQIFNYIDWNTYNLEGWEHSGRCHFFEDYIGQGIMLKAHTNTFNIRNLRFNWENPFLFYDHDDDGLTEMAVRLNDAPEIDRKAEELPSDGPITEEMRSFDFDGIINGARLTFDLDNDNGPDNEFDFDLSLRFTGKGFDYSDQVHTYKSMRGLEGSEKYFFDPRWREMTELVFAGHETAYDLVFDRGQWDECWLIYDEDDDCQRWERVEFYEPLDPFRSGARNLGLDNNPQADVSGDRGEWDTDFSGKGNLYIGTFDGRIHLHGAEWGCWRIDQNASYYQGWQGWRGPNIQPEDNVTIEPEIFATIKYTDANNNGFIDQIHYDLDGDKNFERIISMEKVGISDICEVINTAELDYDDYRKLYDEIANAQWDNARKAIKVADNYGLNTGWYNNLMYPRCTRDKYHFGYWLNFYIYLDLLQLGELKADTSFLINLDKAFYGRNWEILF